jgi:hypothetical protein
MSTISFEELAQNGRGVKRAARRSDEFLHSPAAHIQALCASPVSLSPLLTSHELSKAADYLNSTRDSLVEDLRGLSDSQWHFKPAPDRWSIAETLEHLVLIEERVHGLIDRMPDAPPAEPDRINSQVEEIILLEVPKRVIRRQAPAPVLPSHQWSPAEILARFLENRTRTLELLVEAPFLRGHVAPHPFFGAWDGYQWILAVAAHTARHTGQVLELKACSGFPEAHSIPSVSPL